MLKGELEGVPTGVGNFDAAFKAACSSSEIILPTTAPRRRDALLRDLSTADVLFVHDSVLDLACLPPPHQHARPHTLQHQHDFRYNFPVHGLPNLLILR